ncbi:hypothetical protein [Pontimicrobium sp. IMCC45349]|uniref:hypothetical protein n=1 Tax=Pontimicrobium sp. IMCC45349 TaxID=3391574 RepID=UPI00399F5558
MKLFSSKVLSGFGKKKKVVNIQDTNYTDTIIKSISEKAIAISEENVMYAAAKELGGYYYFKTIVVGRFKIKTFKGATLTVKGQNQEFVLKTDMDEFESDYSEIPNTFVTSIDFQIEKGDIKKLQPNLINSLTLKAKKHEIVFKPVKD